MRPEDSRSPRDGSRHSPAAPAKDSTKDAVAAAGASGAVAESSIRLMTSASPISTTSAPQTPRTSAESGLLATSQSDGSPMRPTRLPASGRPSGFARCSSGRLPAAPDVCPPSARPPDKSTASRSRSMAPSSLGPSRNTICPPMPSCWSLASTSSDAGSEFRPGYATSTTLLPAPEASTRSSVRRSVPPVTTRKIDAPGVDRGASETPALESAGAYSSSTAVSSMAGRKLDATARHSLTDTWP